MRHNPAAGAVVIMLRTLKMHGMAQAVGELTEQGSPAFEAAVPILSQLLKAETADREVRSTAYQLKAARFPNYRDLAGFDFASSEVNEALARQLHRCEFLEDAHNVVLVGGPGTGKTHLATAIGVQAIEHHRKRVVALSESGTLCSRPAFMRVAGMVQTFSFQIISDHFAPKISPVRVAVRMQTSSARAAIPKYSAQLLHQGGDISVCHRCVMTAFKLWPLRQKGDRWPRQAAGFSPERWPCAFAASRTASTRPRSRDAVSGFSIQIGFRTREDRLRIDLIDRTRRKVAVPSIKLERHYPRCLALPHSCALVLLEELIGDFAKRRLLSQRSPFSLRTSIGLRPDRST